MARHAYLIMAHQNFDFLRELITALDDARNDIYLHVSRNAADFRAEDFSALPLKGRLILVERRDVCWGGFSQTACELALLRAAAPSHYAYYHLLSGADYPLKSQEEIHAFFEAHEGQEFLAFDPEVPAHVRERISLYHFFRESRNALAEPADHLLTLLQRALHVDRLKNSSLELGKGPNWFSITDGFAQYVLEHADWIEQACSRSVCADEIFLQTLILNSPFRDRIYDREGRTGSMANLRYVDWERGSGNSPYTFRDEDRELLQGLPHLFARKFEHNIFRETS